MKKTIAVLMVLVLSILFVPAVFADGTTVLTVVVPSAGYELVIPESQTIPYGQTETLIGPVTVANSHDFTDGKYVTAQVSYGPLETAGGAQIEYFLRSVKNGSGSSAPMDGKTIIFDNDGNGGVEAYGYVLDSQGHSYPVDDLSVVISEEKWEAAQPGTYTSNVTFTSQIVTPEA